MSRCIKGQRLELWGSGCSHEGTYQVQDDLGRLSGWMITDLVREEIITGFQASKLEEEWQIFKHWEADLEMTKSMTLAFQGEVEVNLEKLSP